MVAGCLPVGGDRFDEALIQYVRQTHNLLLGLRTAEQVKHTIGQVGQAQDSPSLAVKGRCLTTGLPREVQLTPADTAEAFAPVAREIVSAVQGVLERTPPELAADVAKNGILLTGGGSLLRGMDRLLAEATGIDASASQEPETCVVLGLEMTLPRLSKRQDGPLHLARRRQVGAE